MFKHVTLLITLGMIPTLAISKGASQRDCEKGPVTFAYDPVFQSLLAVACKWQESSLPVLTQSYLQNWKTILNEDDVNKKLPWSDPTFANSFKQMLKAENSYYQNPANPALNGSNNPKDPQFKGSVLGTLGIVLNVEGDKIPDKQIIRSSLDIVRGSSGDEGADTIIQASLIDIFKSQPEKMIKDLAAVTEETNKSTKNKSPNYLSDLAKLVIENGEETALPEMKKALTKALQTIATLQSSSAGRTAEQLKTASKDFLKALPTERGNSSNNQHSPKSLQFDDK